MYMYVHYTCILLAIPLDEVGVLMKKLVRRQTNKKCPALICVCPLKTGAKTEDASRSSGCATFPMTAETTRTRGRTSAPGAGGSAQSLSSSATTTRFASPNLVVCFNIFTCGGLARRSIRAPGSETNGLFG